MNKVIEIKRSGDIKSTVCQFAWDYSVLNISRNELRNCCRSKSHKILPEDWRLERGLFTHFPPIVNVRKDMLRGIRNEACGVCWDIEDSGAKSARTSWDRFVNFIYSKKLWPTLSRDELKEKLQSLNDDEIEMLSRLPHTNMIEISLGNICDLKCLYCHHHYSSQWAAEVLKYGEIKPEEMEAELPKIKDTIYETYWWDWFENESGYNTYCINFIGGEPLIIDKFYSYADRICQFYEDHTTEQKNIDFSIVTNFNTPKKFYDRFLDTTMRIVSNTQFTLDFNVSCESIGKRAEYIRTGTDWEIMTENIEHYIEFINLIDPDQNRVIFNLQIALNALCISDLPNFMRWVIDLQDRTNRKIHLRQNQISHPHWLSPYILPSEYSIYVGETIDIMAESLKHSTVTRGTYNLFGRWDHYMSFLQTVKRGIENPEKNTKARIQFAENIEKMRQRRNLNFEQTFREMIPFLIECKKLQ